MSGGLFRGSMIQTVNLNLEICCGQGKCPFKIRVESKGFRVEGLGQKRLPATL